MKKKKKTPVWIGRAPKKEARIVDDYHVIVCSRLPHFDPTGVMRLVSDGSVGAYLCPRQAEAVLGRRLKRGEIVEVKVTVVAP